MPARTPTAPDRPRTSPRHRSRLFATGPQQHLGDGQHVLDAAETIAPKKIARKRHPKRSKLLDRFGWYEPRPEGAWSTTRQAEALNLAISRRSVRHEGPVTGLNLISQDLVITDPFELYGTDISNINVCVVGDIGKGKSSLIKTASCWRQLILGRQVVVIDKKRQGSEGEYSIFARTLGVESVRFKTGGGGARLNLLDRAITTGGEHAGGLDGVTPAGQEALVLAVLADTMERPLTTSEKSAVGRALELVNQEALATGREPVLEDLARRLIEPRANDGDYFGDRWSQRSLEWGYEPGLALLRLVDRDLKGLVDAPTSPEVRAALEHPFAHFDVSALPTEGPALRVVMTVINTWLANLLAARSSISKQTILIVEEGWHVAEGSTGNVFRSNMKLSRGLGLSTTSAFHHPSDMSKDSPARALMQEAGIVFLFAQERYDDARETAEMYHLPPGSVDIIMGLGQGECLVKIGSADPILMQHVRSPEEIALTDTDTAVKGTRAA
ncbi:ATP/GTP-binding protein [Rhodococcus sp. 06-156-3C]|uniref:ATP/GTP-binding protein n=1 Tax=Nocardiaceae TaxID=85025 RepID=UPI000522F107|nr:MULTISPECIES: ATP/GTP-binding protein [Rhodococcus]OZD13016.1 ATP/GTP-binding protein [Rhodococcus sp. 06-156-4a]OZD17885.1 ATP/GTP-binding protein [Rhodococcus sp. 06-156-3C]OZD20610.1 ATP/GTP-binding protein [Rhodococcus sp. 06-156-4C]OZD30671.1 ATP/GTP-binding protein [Rhodococcus sp. 06-156-3b]OZD32555.1 ATP/GTP-binding protein [Rhodococcus sp. 06-156-3]